MTTQTTLDYRTNRDLFSNYHLDEHLPDTEAWNEIDDDELQAAYDGISQLWERERGTASQRNESQLEDSFIRPMFRKLGIPFEVEESTESTQRRPDYAFFESQEDGIDAFERREEGGDGFYKNAIAVADAKRWGRKLDTRGKKKRDYENPSHQIDQYLRFTSTTWGVLTNGKKWRLYYKPTSHKLDSYYEIDLPTILETGDLEEFKYFYLFFRREAFVPDPSGDAFLDDVYQESNLFAQELGQDLQDNIYDAIEQLSEGFLQYPENDLDESNLSLIHDSSLIYLYRIIFVLYAEAEGRDLLDTNNEIYQSQYSLNQLKQKVTEELESGDPKYRDWQDNLHSQLDELFTLIDQGSKSQAIPKDDLYIPAYNGGLFRTDPDGSGSKEARFLANNTVGDEHIAKVIKLLTRSKSSNGDGEIFVDYSSLDVRHLGSIYEGLLEYQLNVADENLTLDEGEYVVAEEDSDIVVESGDVYLTTDSGERKATGSYYTPEYVVEYIVEESLHGLVDQIRKDVVMDEEYQDGGYADEFADRVFDLKILDPAMGSGHFLTSVVDYLARKIITEQNREAEQKGGDIIEDDHDINWARRKVAQRCIYGVDINPLATELAKVSLWLRTLAAEQPLAFLDHHLKTGNSLVGSDIQDVLVDDDGSKTDEGQLTLEQSFAHTRKQALDHVMDRFSELLAIDNETLEDAKEMEAVYKSVQNDSLYQKLIAMANVHTASQFGLDVPSDADKRMAEALRDDSWKAIEQQDWFNTAQTMADDNMFFHWELEFPVPFYDMDGDRIENAGFDTVIGNPPYGYRKIPSDQEKEYYSSNYESHQYNYEFYVYFTEKAINLTQNNKLTSYIIPNTYISADNMESMRKYILDNCTVSEIYSLGQGVFEGVTLESVIQTLEVGKSDSDVRVRIGKNTHDLGSPEKEYKIPQNQFESSDKYMFNISLSPERRSIVKKIKKETPLEDLAYVTVGINTGYIKDVLVSDHKEDGRFHRMVSGNDIDRYHLDWDGDWICYDHDLIEEYGDKARSLPPEYIFSNDKILLQRTRRGLDRKLVATLDKDQHYNLNRASNVVLDEDTPYDIEYILGLLNSNLLDMYFNWIFDEYEVKPSHLNKIPIKELEINGTTDTDISNIKKKYQDYISSEISPQEVIQSFENKNDQQKHDILAFFAKTIGKNKTELKDMNLNLLDYLGNYSDGNTLSNIGLTQPSRGAGDSILQSTTENYPSLRVGKVSINRESDTKVEIQLTARYKPTELGKEESGPVDDREPDQWGYVETDPIGAIRITDLTKIEADLIEAFVPVAVDKAGGFADFRDTATKTNSLLDRLKVMTLPKVNDIVDDLEGYIEVKDRADNLENKIEKTDELIDKSVYNLYELTDDEIKIVESAITDD